MRMMWRLVCRLKARGSRISFMLGFAGSWLPLRRLQEWQQATRFSQVDEPPRERGMTWSSVSSPAARTVPQYWQVLRSRSRMFLRDRARRLMRNAAVLQQADHRRQAHGHAGRVQKVSVLFFRHGHALSTRTKARRAAQTLMGS